MAADVPPSNTLGPDAGFDLGFGWCMDLATNDMNILVSPEPLCFPVLDDAALVTAPLAVATQPLRMPPKNTQQLFPQTSSFQVQMGSPPERSEAPETDKTHKPEPELHQRSQRRNIANAAAQASKPLPPVKKAVGGQATSQSFSQTQCNGGNTLPAGRGHAQQPGKTRLQSASLDIFPPSAKAGGPVTSSPAVKSSRPSHRAISSNLSQDHLPFKKPSLTGVRQGQRNDAARPSASHQQRTKVDRAARLGRKTDVAKLSISVSDYQRHVMNLVELIKKERV
ncbi:hypothetical protein LZ31DRAFT_560542 [Colletotrichum somersetense]|nr:hypothetical protein LZ31DRAFT_560542 [Colletotrichum somersetense]